jgi:hypothetical protein
VLPGDVFNGLMNDVWFVCMYHRFLLIERSRLRHPYAAPWGISIPTRKKKDNGSHGQENIDEFELDDEDAEPQTVNLQ